MTQTQIIAEVKQWVVPFNILIIMFLRYRFFEKSTG